LITKSGRFAISRENSLIKQSSILSEASQTSNLNKLTDFFEKDGFNRKGSFGMKNKSGELGCNSGFVPNKGTYSRGNSFIYQTDPK
jgi:hypothetical protein